MYPVTLKIESPYASVNLRKMTYYEDVKAVFILIHKQIRMNINQSGCTAGIFLLLFTIAGTPGKLLLVLLVHYFLHYC